MRKKLFLAIAMIAYAANGFASNEVTNTLEDSKINLSLLTSNDEESTEMLETPSFSKWCSTTSYGYYTSTSLYEGTDMTGQPYSQVVITYVITGECTTCTAMGHDGVATTTECWGYGY